MSNEFVKYFLTGFFSVFKTSQMTIRKKSEVELIEYFTKIEKDANITFQEIKREYERQ